jgi:hypothetical protein
MQEPNNLEVINTSLERETLEKQFQELMDLAERTYPGILELYPGINSISMQSAEVNQYLETAFYVSMETSNNEIIVA